MPYGLRNANTPAADELCIRTPPEARASQRNEKIPSIALFVLGVPKITGSVQAIINPVAIR